MKALKPSHREKKRYLLIKGKDVSKKTIENVILEFIGVLGYAESSPQIIKSSKASVILAINRKSLEKVRASFVMSKKDLQITKVSGAVGKLK
tara:strand:- start:1619 stop:1894 length:276 start_codon:yes stop_codon:yes gene_type:complete